MCQVGAIAIFKKNVTPQNKAGANDLCSPFLLGTIEGGRRLSETQGKILLWVGGDVSI